MLISGTFCKYRKQQNIPDKEAISWKLISNDVQEYIYHVSFIIDHHSWINMHKVYKPWMTLTSHNDMLPHHAIHTIPSSCQIGDLHWSKEELSQKACHLWSCQRCSTWWLISSGHDLKILIKVDASCCFPDNLFTEIKAKQCLILCGSLFVGGRPKLDWNSTLLQTPTSYFYGNVAQCTLNCHMANLSSVIIKRRI